MNLRIRQLKQQAFEFVAWQNKTKSEYFWQNIRHNQELQDKVDEKFAELIVRECANQVDWILAEGGKTQGDLIKEHFGVKQ
jgi:uncharacterized protein YgbK (DUF1537 family)